MTPRLEDTIKAEEHKIIKKRTKIREVIYGSIIAVSMYLLFELAMAGFNVPLRIDTFMKQEELEQLYNARHRFWYEYAMPSDIGFETRPALEMLICAPDFCVPVNTDKYGFRNKEGDAEKSTMVIIGDSFAFGYGVKSDESWARLLEKQLQKEEKTNKKNKLANFSTMAGAPWIYEQIINKYSHFFKSKLILYSIYSNDFKKTAPQNPRDFYHEKKIDIYEKPIPDFEDLINMENPSLLQRTATYFFIKTLKEKTEGKLSFKNGENDVDSDWLNNGGYEELLTYYKRVIKFAEDNGSKICFVFFPSRISASKQKYLELYSNTLSVDEEEEAYNRIKTFLLEREILFIDLTSSIRKHTENGKELYFDVDEHPNQSGNKIFAEEVHTFLKANKLVM